MGAPGGAQEQRDENDGGRDGRGMQIIIAGR